MARKPEKASRVDSRVGLFDRFADSVARFTARSLFFILCLALVIVWAPSILIVKDLDTWQLLINTPTTVVTFLLVALLQNTQSRADKAIQAKLNALLDGLSPLLDHHGIDSRNPRQAIGLETRESSDGSDT